MTKKKSNPLANQPCFIQYAYLDLKNEYVVNDFLESVEQSDEFQEMISPMPPRLSVSSNLQKHILFVLNAWHSENVSSDVIISDPQANVWIEVETWLQEHRPQPKFRAMKRDFVEAEEEYHDGYANLDLRGFLVEEIIEAMSSGRKIQRCQAEDCKKYFVEAPQGSQQKYCSAKCRNRMWARKNR